MKLLWNFLLPLLLSLTFHCNAQTVVPPENAGNIDTGLGKLDYPENYERAIILMNAYQDSSNQALSDYYSLQALSWAKEKYDSTRVFEVLINMGTDYIRKGYSHQADSIYTLALGYATLDQQKATVYINKIGRQLRISNWSRMQECLDSARLWIGVDTLSPLMAKYYFSKGLFHYEAEEDFIAALVEYQKAKSIRSDDSIFLNLVDYNLTNLYLQIQLYDKAKVMIQKNLADAIAANHINQELFALYSLGYINLETAAYSELKQVCDSIFALQQKHNISEAFGYAYFLLGEYYYAQNQLDSARVIFERGINYSRGREEEKEVIDCLGGLMRTCVAQGKYEEAIKYGEQALALPYRPDHKIEEQLAHAYWEIGRYQEAYELLKSFTEKNNSEELRRTNVRITEKLLEDKHRQDKKAAKLLFEKEFENRRFQFILSILGVILVAAFITVFLQAQSRRKLKTLNDSLVERNESLKQFAYITSHDLKEPIRNITSFSNLLSRRLSQKENTADEKDFLAFIASNAIVLKEIVDSLQIFTNISFGKIVKEKVALDAVFETLQDGLQQTIVERNGGLVFQNASEVEEIYFSRSMLILVLQNLILNGLKYNDSVQPKVEVRVYAAVDGKVRFEVEDNGEGIDSVYFEKIFSPFKTLKNKSVTQSSGLGLSICKNILERYGGRIWVESDGKTGSTFFVLV